jgi:hypothetical protein
MDAEARAKRELAEAYAKIGQLTVVVAGMPARVAPTPRSQFEAATARAFLEWLYRP